MRGDAPPLRPDGAARLRLLADDRSAVVRGEAAAEDRGEYAPRGNTPARILACWTAGLASSRCWSRARNVPAAAAALGGSEVLRMILPQLSGCARAVPPRRHPAGATGAAGGGDCFALAQLGIALHCPTVSKDTLGCPQRHH